MAVATYDDPVAYDFAGYTYDQASVTSPGTSSGPVGPGFPSGSNIFIPRFPGGGEHHERLEQEHRITKKDIDKALEVAKSKRPKPHKLTQAELLLLLDD